MSFFSPKPKSQARQSSSSGKIIGQFGQLTGGGGGGFDSKSTFSKMRKKRPPPINISLERGNVILTNATSNGNIIYTDIPWGPSSPPTPRTVSCINPRCMARDTFFTSPPLTSHCTPMNPCQSCAPIFNTKCSCQQCYPTAELPGSFKAPFSAELDVPSTPTRFTFDQGEDQMSDSPPDLIPSSAADPADEGGTAFSFEPSPVREPTRDGKYLSQMSYEELMEILPDLSTEQIKVYWQPAIQRELPRVNQKQKERVPSEAEVRARKAEDERETFTNRDVERIRSECEVRLNTKENEISGLLHLHDARMKMLCGFITSRFGLKLYESDDPSLQAVKDLVTEQEKRVSEPLHADKLHIMQCRQIEELQEHIAKLETVTVRGEKKIRAYKRENKSLKQDLISLKEDGSKGKEELSEKDNQIATLNNKVVQLLTMRPVEYRHSVQQPIEKDLPSPGPREWNRTEELNMALQHSISMDTVTSWNFLDAVESLDARMGQGSIYSHSTTSAT